jgi:pimeloyl-ACP methyl ester carboxylesterase
VLHGDYAACDAFDVMERLEEIRCPTLAICGTADRLTPLKYSVYLRDHTPGAELVLVDTAGHMVMLEKPEVVARAVFEFIASLT